jgi:hypothetical protein
LLRAPALVQRRERTLSLPPLSNWATVRRGYATCANSFFYLDRKTIEQWGIEAEFRRPLLKSLRAVNHLEVGPADCRRELLLITPDAALAGTAAEQYVAWGESLGLPQRMSCASRQPWYCLPPQSPAPLVLPKGIWRRHLAPLLASGVVVDQQLYLVGVPAGADVTAAAALLNSSWFAWQCEMNGRAASGNGLLWLATYEIEQIGLPDPSRLADDERSALAASFRALAALPVEPAIAALDQEPRRRLDDLVFPVIGLSLAEGEAIREALREQLRSRENLAIAARGGESAADSPS